MAKHGENIRKRKDGRWEARVVVPNFGKTKYKSIYAKTYSELKQKLQTQQPTEKTPYHNPKEFEEICSEWLANIQIKNKQSTFTNYQYILERHILPYFKQIDRNEIQQETIHDFIKKKQKTADWTKKAGCPLKQSLIW